MEIFRTWGCLHLVSGVIRSLFKIQDAPVGCALSTQWKAIATLVSLLLRPPDPTLPHLTSRRTRFCKIDPGIWSRRLPLLDVLKTLLEDFTLIPGAFSLHSCLNPALFLACREGGTPRFGIPSFNFLPLLVSSRPGFANNSSWLVSSFRCL